MLNMWLKMHLLNKLKHLNNVQEKEWRINQEANNVSCRNQSDRCNGDK